MTMQGILVDCEPCVRMGTDYELEGLPLSTCPWEKQGNIAGVPLCCVSWEAILWDYFYYLEEVPQSSWRSPDFECYALARAALDDAESDRLHKQLKAQYAI